MQHPEGCRADRASEKLPTFPNLPLLGAAFYYQGFPGAGGDFSPPVLRWLLWFFSSAPETLFLALMVPHSSSRVGSAAGRGAGNGSPHPALGKPSRLAKT